MRDQQALRIGVIDEEFNIFFRGFVSGNEGEVGSPRLHRHVGEVWCGISLLNSAHLGIAFGLSRGLGSHLRFKTTGSFEGKRVHSGLHTCVHYWILTLSTPLSVFSMGAHMRVTFH